MLVNAPVTIVVATYGRNPAWELLADRAVASANHQGAAVLHVHGNTLASARNEAAYYANTDWLIFLDADDELAPGYVEAMLDGEGDIRKPSTLGIVDGVPDDYPVMIPRRNLLFANHIVIGSMCRHELFTKCGGFRELPALEDWDLWLNMCLTHDAVIGECPDAIYKIHVSTTSRNQNLSNHSTAYSAVQAWAKPLAEKRGINEL